MICDNGDLGPEHQREFDDRMGEFCTRFLRAGLASDGDCAELASAVPAVRQLICFPPTKDGRTHTRRSRPLPEPGQGTLLWDSGVRSSGSAPWVGSWTLPLSSGRELSRTSLGSDCRLPTMNRPHLPQANRPSPAAAIGLDSSPDTQ